MNSFNSKLQLKDSESAIENKPIDIMNELKGFKVVTTIILKFKMIESNDKRKYTIFYFHSKAEIIIKESEIDYVFKSIYTIIISRTHKFLGKVSGWVTESVIGHNINPI